MDDLRQTLASMSHHAPPERPSALLDTQPEDETDDWTVAAPRDASTRSVERPAEVSERLQAASVDALIIGLLAALASYSAARVVQVPVAGLSPVWPWLAFWTALFSAAYAAYFTGTTGQTPGKMLLGLRVVAGTGAGLPPRYVPALLRAVMGSCGNAVLLGLIPMLFDPAHRGLHDRVFRTRVIKR